MPATYAAAVLLRTYSLLLVLSAGLAGLLWYLGREPIHKLTFGLWLSGFLCIALQGLFLRFDLAMVLAFSSSILPVLTLVNLIGLSTRVPLPNRRYLLFYAAAVAGAAAAAALHLSFWAMALLPALASTYPPVDVSVRAWPRGKPDPTRLLKVLCVVSFLYGVHHLAYPFLRQSEAAAPYGYTVAIALFFMLSILLPAYTTSFLAAEYAGRLEQEVAVRTAQLKQANEELKESQGKVVRSEKLAAIGKLASGVKKSLELPPSVRLTETYPSGLPRAMLDPQRLGQVLINLATNAVQAMAKTGGELRISTRAEQEGGTAWVVAEISDTGEGITPENLKKLFEPLFTTKAKGTGLGLAISRSYVEAHGGAILVASEPGKGSVFSVRLPVGAPKDA